MKRLFLSFCYLPDTMMFKLEELHAVCRTLGTTVNVVGEAEGTGGVFITADFENLEIARRVCRRLTLLKGAFELWGKGGDDGFAEMKESIMAGTYVSPDERAKYKDVTFKFVFDAIGCKISWTEKVARFNRLSDIGLDGKIEMDNPSEVFYIIEDRGLPTSNKKDLPPLARVYFARLIEQGARREFDTYSLKTRKYIGTTTMIPELCMLMANVACVTKNSLVWDPFCGTGSTLVSSAHYGAQCFGSDLDGRALGTQENGIQSNCKQYGFQPFELMRTDLSKVPFRSGLTEFLDAIISDPPYGRREPRKKIDETRQNQLEEFITSMTDDQQQARLDRIHTTDYIPPPKMEYALPQLLTDLVSTAAKLLRVGGRLVYWHPTTKNYDRSELPKHPAMRLVSDLGQSVSIKLKRHLVVMEKTRAWAAEDVTVAPTIPEGESDFHFKSEAHNSEQYLAYKAKRAAKHAASIKFRQDNGIAPGPKLTKSERRKCQMDQIQAKKTRKEVNHAASVITSKETTRMEQIARGKISADDVSDPASPPENPSAKKRRLDDAPGN